jgi:hypothetical protein
MNRNDGCSSQDEAWRESFVRRAELARLFWPNHGRAVRSFGRSRSRRAAVKLAPTASMRRNNIPYADFFFWEIRRSKSKTSVIDRVCSGAGIFLK